MLPLHQAVHQLGSWLVKRVIIAHLLIREDCFSKLGSKHAAVAFDSVHYLKIVDRRTRCWSKMQHWQKSIWYVSAQGLGYLQPPRRSTCWARLGKLALFFPKAVTFERSNEKPSWRARHTHKSWRTQGKTTLEHRSDEHIGAMPYSKCLNALHRSALTTCKCADKWRCGCRSV